MITAIQKTLRLSMEAVQEASDFSYALRNFLDRFRNNPSVGLLLDEPASLTTKLSDDGLADAYLAAAAVGSGPMLQGLLPRALPRRPCAKLPGFRDRKCSSYVACPVD